MQRERRGVCSRKREQHEQKGGDNCRACLKNKGFRLPRAQKQEEELMELERCIVGKTQASDGRGRRLYVLSLAVGSY